MTDAPDRGHEATRIPRGAMTHKELGDALKAAEARVQALEREVARLKVNPHTNQSALIGGDYD